MQAYRKPLNELAYLQSPLERISSPVSSQYAHTPLSCTSPSYIKQDFRMYVQEYILNSATSVDPNVSELEASYVAVVLHLARQLHFVACRKPT